MTVMTKKMNGRIVITVESKLFNKLSNVMKINADHYVESTLFLEKVMEALVT